MEIENFSSNVENSWQKKLMNWSIIVSFLLVIVVTFFWNNIAYNVIKNFILSIGIFIAGIAFISHTIKVKELKITKNLVFLSLLSASIFSLISSLTSGNIIKSLSGYGVETYTSIFILSLLFFVFYSINLFNDRERLVRVYKWMYWFFSAFVVVHFISIILPRKYIFNLLGSYTDLGVFFALFSILSVISCIYLSNNFKQRVIYGLLALISFFGQITLTFWFKDLFIVSTIVLILITISSIIYSRSNVYDSDTPSKNLLKNIPWLAVVMIVISLFFIFAQVSAVKYSAKIFGQSHYSYSFFDSVIVPWKISFDSAKNILIEDPILGPGPNLYLESFLINRPDNSNYSVLWNTDVRSNRGLFNTYGVSTGFLGSVLWLFFAILVLWRTGKYLFVSDYDRKQNTFILASSAGTLFLLGSMFILPPNVAIVLITFGFISLFILSENYLKEIPNFYFSLVSESPEQSKLNKILRKIVFYAIITIVAVISIYGVYSFGTRLYAIVLANKAFSPKVLSQPEKQKVLLNKSAKIGLDINYGYLSSAYLSEVLYLTSKSTPEDIKAEEKAQIEKNIVENFQKSIDSANSAVKIDPENYRNYLYLIDIYESAMYLGAKDAYESASTTYMKVIELNPKSPYLFYRLAKLHANTGDVNMAIVSLQKSLNLKNDYIDALVLAADISESQKDITGALNLSALAVQALQRNSSSEESTILYNKLGGLLYINKNYEDAVKVLSRAVELNPEYSNARFFLGASLAKLGKFDEAIIQFEKILELNKGNKDIQTILNDLKAGRQPVIQADTTNNVKISPNQPATSPKNTKK